MKENEEDKLYYARLLNKAVMQDMELSLYPELRVEQVTEDAEYEIVEPIKIDNNKTEQK